MENDKKRPAFSCKVGAIEAAAWEHKGDNRTFYNVTVSRRYKDRNDEQWKSTTSFGVDDIPKLQLALSKCYEWILLRRSGDGRAAQASDGLLEEELIPED
jgi:hypothetical protein